MINNLIIFLLSIDILIAIKNFAELSIVLISIYIGCVLFVAWVAMQVNSIELDWQRPWLKYIQIGRAHV